MVTVPQMTVIRAPSGDDPRWEGWSAPVLEYLSEGPKTWEQLEAWRKKTRTPGSLLRHCLAWLEDQGRVRSKYMGKVIVWERFREELASPA